MIPSFKTYFYQVFLENADVDKQYFEAIKNQDEQTLRKLVDQKAEENGYNIGPVYHASYSKDGVPFYHFNKSNDPSGGFWFSEKDMTSLIGGNITLKVLLSGNPKILKNGNQDTLKKMFKTYGPTTWKTDAPSGIFSVKDDEYNTTSFLVRYGNMVKLQDLITKDESGEIIPLSKRFDSSTDDIRY
jgi:hypothetical protein